MSNFNNLKREEALKCELKKYKLKNKIEGKELLVFFKEIEDRMRKVSYASEYYDCAIGLEENFDENFLIYRTAFAALCMKKAVSQGYADAIEMILSQNGFRSCKFLSAIKQDNFDAIVHTIIAVPYGEKYVIIDPMRKSVCAGSSYEKLKSTAQYFFMFAGYEGVGTDGAGMRLSSLYGKTKEVNQKKLMYL